MGYQAPLGLTILITRFLWTAALQWPAYRQSGPWPTTVSLYSNVIRSAQQVPFTASCVYQVLTNKTEITCALVFRC